MNELRSESPSKTTGYIKTHFCHFWTTKACSMLLSLQHALVLSIQKIWCNQHDCLFPWRHITLHFCIVLDWIFWTINVFMYCLFSDPSGNCSLTPGYTITFWKRWGVREHLQSSFCCCPWLSEVYELRLALKCGSGLRCSSHSQSSVFKSWEIWFTRASSQNCSNKLLDSEHRVSN
jgi:hypothetical protein